ncbi:MAG: SprB repeat-containing protein [Chitinophagales bacterium]
MRPNGAASVMVAGSGGTAGLLRHAWTGGATGTSVSNLSSGSYTVTVTDSKGCTATNNFSVSQPTSLPSATVTPTAVSCFGGTNGAASVTGSGGTAGYTYAWTGGATGTSVSNLSSGSYTVTVTDSKGCTATKAFSVSQPTSLPSASTIPNSGELLWWYEWRCISDRKWRNSRLHICLDRRCNRNFCFEFKQRQLYGYSY